MNFKKAAGWLLGALIVVPLAVVGIAAVTMVPRERVYAFNVPNPTACVSGIVYFIDKKTSSIITHVIDDKTDKPQHCK